MITKFPIQLTPTLRIDEGDKNQYFIQKKATLKGEIIWQNIRFCGTLKGLVSSASDVVASFYEQQARKSFNDHGLPELLMKLPEKTGR